QFPVRKELDDAEMERIQQIANVQLEDARDDLENAENEDSDEDERKDSDDEMEVDGGVSLKDSATDKKEGNKEDKNNEDDDLAEYNLDTYDDEEEVEGEPLGMFNNIKGLAYYKPGEEDPYI